MIKYFISIIFMLVLKTSICHSQEVLGLDIGFDYSLNYHKTNEYDIIRTDQNGNILWKLSFYNNNIFFDSTQSHYVVFGYTFEKNGKIISDPTEYDYWLVPKIKDKEFSIFPNPSSGLFNIYNYSDEEKVQYEIYDSCNKLILTNQLININTTVNLVNFSKGIYFIRLLKNDETLKFEKICIN